MSPPLKLQLAEGFREVVPRPCGQRLLWEEDGVLRLSETDFAAPRGLARIGGVDCPLAVDSARGLAWAYCCQFRLDQRDFSEIREFDLGSGRSRRLLRLGLHQWSLWMLAHWAGHNALLALVATHTGITEINIRHHLALIDTRSGEMRLVALPRDAFVPLAWCERRRWIIFHGAEGTHLVSFAGRLLHSFAPSLREPRPLGRGASIHPEKSLALLGGDGLWLWDLESGRARQVRDRGQHPRWTPGGEGCWFSESSSDLFYLDLNSGAERRLLRIAGNPLTEVNYARPCVLDAAGARLAFPLTRLLRTDLAAASPTLARLHRLCVLDLATREAWQAPGYSRNLAWV